MYDKPRRWSRLLALALSTIVSLLLAEGIVRIVAPQRLYSPIFADVNGITVLRPNVRGRWTIPRTFDTELSTNAEGFRESHTISLKPRTGTRRIIMIGDSFTFGIGANDAEAYPRFFEQFLRSKGVSVEVVNAGVPGTGTGEQALYYAERVARYEADFVIITVHWGDVEDDLARGLFERDGDTVRPFARVQLDLKARPLRNLRSALKRVPGYETLANHSHLVNLFRQVIVRRTNVQADSSATGADVSPSDFAMTRGELGWLDAAVRKQRTRLIVIYVPERFDVVSRESPKHRESSLLLASELSKFSGERSILFINAVPLVVHANAAPDTFFYSGADEHPRPAGYRVFGRIAADALEPLFR
jgi:GDSL-like Lipase/Acylhydrolase family